MASSIPPAPPPPPPPPPQQPAKVLDAGRRPPKDSHRVLGVRPAQSEERSIFSKIHPETLQHSIANLRKTEYREPLLSCQSESEIRRPNHLASRRHWEDLAFDVSMDQHPSGEPLHAANTGPVQSVPLGVGHGHPYSLNPAPSAQIYQQPQVPSNNNNNGSSSYSYSYSSSSAPFNNGFNNGNNSVNSSSSSVNNNGFRPLNQTTHLYASPIQSNVQSSNNNNGVSSSSSTYSTVYSSSSNASNNNFASSNLVSPYAVINQGPSSAFKQLSPSPRGGHDNFSPIINPQSHIHQYATQTPAYVPIPVHVSTVQSPPPSNGTNNSLARELRDSGLTERQKYSNQFQKSLLPSSGGSSTIHNLYQETQKYTSNVADPVNELIKDMEYKMRTNYGGGGGGGSSSATNQTTTTTTTTSSTKVISRERDFCAKCGSQIVGETPGVTALGNAYHVTCFACDVCQKQLAGCSFYSVDGKNLCQVDYMNSLEKCEKCLTPITQKILRAMGKPFHPECFACPACSKSLDGIPFTVDKENSAYCLECYHERFSPRCAVCLKAIAPSGNETEVARVIAMDRSYHIDCYRCEDCGMKLNSKVEGQGCYPLENHLFCKACNLNRLKTVH